MKDFIAARFSFSNQRKEKVKENLGKNKIVNNLAPLCKNL